MKKFPMPLALGFLLLALAACKKDHPVFVEPGTDTKALDIVADSVKLNPFGNAPLVATVGYTSTVEGHTRVTVIGKNGTASNISHEFNDIGLQHKATISGLYADYLNTVEVSLLDAKGAELQKTTLKITTGALPVNIPNYMKTDSYSVGETTPGLNLVSSFAGFPNPPQTPFIMDNYGDIRWWLDFTNHPDLKNLFYDDGISVLKNGNFYFADQSSARIYEVDVLGRIINKWSFPGYTFHHNVTEKPNGNFLVSVSKDGSKHTNGTETIEDYIIEIDRNSGSLINTWDLKESLDEYRTTLTTDAKDWIHVNAVIYDPTDNTIIISGRTQGVIKLSNDNQVKWILGLHKGWGKNRRGEDLNQFLLDPLDAAGNKITDIANLEGATNHTDFEWNWYQHSPIIIPNGDLMLFDNGANRNFGSAPAYSRAVEFKINSTARTVQQIWQYGKERGAATFSAIVSSVKFMPGNNHILFSPGYQVANASGKGGKIVEIDYASKKVVLEMSVSSASGWGFHRVERIAF